jgi:hypothetical protein
MTWKIAWNHLPRDLEAMQLSFGNRLTFANAVST